MSAQKLPCIAAAGLLLLQTATVPTGATPQTINYTHDANGRLTGAVYEAGPEAIFEYDASGNLVRIAVQAGAGGAQEEESGLPPVFAAGPGLPNPFSSRTQFRFELPRAARVHFRVLDPGGRLVRTLIDGDRPAGVHTILWDGADDRGRALPSGMYFTRVQADGKGVTRAVAILR